MRRLASELIYKFLVADGDDTNFKGLFFPLVLFVHIGSTNFSKICHVSGPPPQKMMHLIFVI